MSRKSFLLPALLLWIHSLCAQNAIGTWQLQLPYRQVTLIEDAGDQVIGATVHSIFRFTKKEGYVTQIDKVSGLSDVGVSAMAYDAESEVLAIGYTNSNIDLLKNGNEVYNLPSLKLENIAASKKINKMRFYGGLLYVCLDLGIMVVDPQKMEVREFYSIGSTGAQIPVKDLQLVSNRFYALTTEGLKTADRNASNLQDYNNWSALRWPNGSLLDSFTLISSALDKLYAIKYDSTYAYDGTSWSLHTVSTGYQTLSAHPYNNRVYLGQKGMLTGTASYRIVEIAPIAGPVRDLQRAQMVSDAYIDANGNAWAADEYQGLIAVRNGNEEVVRPAGPFSAKVFQMAFYRDRLFVATGGVDAGWNYLWNSDGIFEKGTFGWSERNLYNTPALNNYSDLVSTTVNTRTGKIYFGSYLSGLVELNLNDNTLKTYDKNNSVLGKAVGDSMRTKISAVCTDKRGNTWVANTAAVNALTVITPSGEWYPLYLPFLNGVLVKKMIADSDGKLWCNLRPTGMAVYDPGRDVTNTSDDSYRILGAGVGYGNLPNTNVLSLAEDKEGNIWIGTDQGIAVFYCPSAVTTTRGCDADRIKVERDGFVAYLFETEAIRALAVDPANRKWIGTTNGVWLISDDGKTELLHFNIDNSPLPSNFIVDITINPTTGEVVIGTESGIISYQGDAIKGGETKGESVEVFPNPVNSEYDGPIAIRGLVDDAYVKITDVSGTLVFQGRANGGQFVWDGKGYKGNRVQSGVYFVYASTDLGKERNVAKIAFIH